MTIMTTRRRLSSPVERCFKCGRLTYAVQAWWGMTKAMVCGGCNKERELCDCKELIPEGIKIKKDEKDTL